MKKINIDLKYLLIIWGVLILSIVLTYARHGSLIIDTGREVYYPTQILLGKVLYKDIFDIYGPFSYLLNAFLFKAFGINLNVLYLSGCVCSFAISTLIYFISKKYLSNFLSFSIAVFTVITGVLTSYLSNFIFPYSYAMLYGLVSFLFAFLFLTKYHENQKSFNLYLSCFFVGLCISSKYEFLPYLLVVLYAMIRIKPLNFKQYFYSIFSLLFMPLFCFGILFLQGLRINDFVNILSILSKMVHTQTFKYFYHIHGLYFNKMLMLYNLGGLLLTLVPVAGLFYAFNAKNKLLAALVAITSSFVLLKVANPFSLALLPILVLVLSIVNFRNLKYNLSLQFLVLSSLLFGLKVFLTLNLWHYGLFFSSFFIIAFIALVRDKLTDKFNYNGFGVYLLLFALILGYSSYPSEYKYQIKTSRGEIYTDGYLYNSSKELIEYIQNNTKKSDRILIFPEGQMINYLTDRPSDDFYNSLIPLYVETMGEDVITSHFKENPPEYIVFNNWNTQDYYFKYICSDYAVSFCNYVAKNYSQEKVIDNGFRYLIFKRSKY